MGRSINPSEWRLALLVSDHPLEYIDFEGIIQKGNYGADPVLIWDRGTYELIDRKEDKIAFLLAGEKLNGAFTTALQCFIREGGDGGGN